MDTSLLPSWQARQDAQIESKFQEMVGTVEEDTPPSPPKPKDVDPKITEGWVGDFLRSTSADVGDVLLRGVSFNLLKSSDIPVLGKMIDAYKTPDDRKTALRKWAEFGLVELPVGFMSPVARLLSPLGKGAASLVSGAGAVTKGAVKVGAEMGTLGAAQQGGEEIRSGGGPGAAGRIAGAAGVGAAFGAVLGGGAAKIEQLVARRAMPKASTGTGATDDAEKAAWDQYAKGEEPVTGRPDTAGEEAWDAFAKANQPIPKTEAIPVKESTVGKTARPMPSIPIEAGPSSLEKPPPKMLKPAPEPPFAPPQMSAREIMSRADTLEGAKLGQPPRARAVIDERITQLRGQAQERAAVEVAEQAATGMKDPEVRAAVQSAVDNGLLVLPEGLGRDLGPAGRINVGLTSLLARATLGAITGAAIGDTDEERATNALALAGGAAILSPRLFKMVASKLGGMLPQAETSLKSTMSVKQGRRILSMRNLSQDEARSMATADPGTIEIPNNRGLSVKYGEITDPGDVQSLIKRVYSEYGEAGSGAVHMTDDQLWKLAREWNLGDILARKPGDPVSRGQLAGAVAIFHGIKGEMDHLLTVSRSGVDLTPEMLHRLSIGAAVSNMIQGGLNEAGATLRIGRIVAEMSNANNIDKLADIATAFGGANAITFDGPIPASAIKDMIAQASKKGILPGWMANLHKDLIGTWINGMLSSGVSFMRNAVGTGVMLPARIAERRMAEVGGNVAPGEASEMLWSIPETLRDAVRLGIASLEARPGLAVTRAALGAGIGATQGDTWDERAMNAASLGAIGAFASVKLPEWGMTKLEGAGMRKLWNPENYGVAPDTFFGKGMALLGDIIQTPGDALRTADNLFKMMGYRAEFRALALREARNATVKTPEAFDETLKRIMDNPSKELMEASRGFAEKNTFTQDLGKFGTWLATTIDSSILSKIVVPFFRTTVNIGKEFLEMAPGVAQLNAANWRAMRAGGAERDLAIAKQALGLTLALPAFYLADKGYILGDMPKHQGTAAIANNLGHQPYSFRPPSGNTISFNGMAPIGWFFGMAADITQMLKHANTDSLVDQVGQFAKAYVLALGKNVAAQSYLQSVGNATQAVMDEDGAKLTRYLQMQSRSIVPRLASNWAAQDDQVRYEIHGMRDAIYSQMPGFSRTVPPLRDPFGDIVYRYGAVGPDSASFLFFRPGTKDPAKQAVLDNNITISRPPRTLFGSGESNVWFSETNPLRAGVPLTPEQYDRYVDLCGNGAKDRRGQGMKDRVTEYAKSDRYKTDSRVGREERILRYVREHREMATNQLLREFPEIGLKAKQLEQARAAAARPGANEADILATLRGLQ